MSARSLLECCGARLPLGFDAAPIDVRGWGGNDAPGRRTQKDYGGYRYAAYVGRVCHLLLCGRCG